MASEQEYISFAYDCLERMRGSARLLQYSVESGAGGTHQARFERDVVEERALERLARLQLGAESLIFGRIDRVGEPVGESNGSASDFGARSLRDEPRGPESFYIGRLPVADSEMNPIVVDWRAPVAEAFYRATGRNPLGLERRRHFSTEGEKLLGIDDEVFTLERLERDDGDGLVGSGALLAALGRARSGYMRDIVATIQSEQDEIIRSELPGLLIVQGGPGTGKTAVALHRASYLLYTHRFPLERQGVLVVGPNRTFIRYIARVLPALGESGVDLAGIDDLFTGVDVNARESHVGARVKGDLRMAKVIRRAVLTRQRSLRDGIVVGFGVSQLKITAAETAEMVAVVKRAHRVHNASRKHLQSLLIDRLYDRYRAAMARKGFVNVGAGVIEFGDFRTQIKRNEEVKLALDRMWPLLSPQMLLRDLFGAPALVKAAARDLLTDEEQAVLIRERAASVDGVAWTSSDIPLLDEAAQLLGPLPKVSANSHPSSGSNDPHDESTRTYGHIIIDEAQDLSPMQLRMVARRSLSGSMTVVGDIGQATGMWAPSSWDEVIRHLPNKREPRLVELTVGYRTPQEVMDLAAKVLAVAAPALRVPTSVRSIGEQPLVVRTERDALAARVVDEVASIRTRLVDGTVGVLCTDDMFDDVQKAFIDAEVTTDPTALQAQGITLLPVRMSKGLEFDGVIVVEPSDIATESAQGLRALFVALTRATRLLTIVHAHDLPSCLTRP